MYFITMTLWSTFNAFNGVREQVRTVKVSRRITKRTKTSGALLNKYLESPKSKRFAVIRRKPKSPSVGTAKETKNLWEIREGSSRPAESAKQSDVSPATALDNYLITFDRDCQVANWKCGFPVPHKNICGKKGYDDNEGTPQLDQFTPPSSGGSEDADDAEIDTGIPAPEPSFKRSPVLLHQISFHTEPNSFVDHVFVRPYPQNDHGVSLGLNDDKMKFLIMPRRAIKTGDEAAVATMYKMLLPYAEKLVFGATKLKAQLKNEDGVDVDTKRSKLV
ncbi:hypothetical protein IW261DRAFT_1589481 [Armillaria novae-zelandiae]|uniref:Uncharacterized protein n=1 Tax=Armillaria novae-zelandiae TaxID=153914 RepID=A0AA39PRV5_9AGAR|nr:hypothetical protein IW261DRAFT_1589481 [Armillaria novae-zelandiae]